MSGMDVRVAQARRFDANDDLVGTRDRHRDLFELERVLEVVHDGRAHRLRDVRLRCRERLRSAVQNGCSHLAPPLSVFPSVAARGEEGIRGAADTGVETTYAPGSSRLSASGCDDRLAGQPTLEMRWCCAPTGVGQ